LTRCGRFVGFALLIGLIASACGTASAPAPSAVGATQTVATTASPTPKPNYGTLRVVYGNVTIANSLFFLATYDKLFEAEGFTDVEQTAIGGGKETATLIGGSADIALVSLDQIIAFATQGAQAQKTRALLQMFGGNPLTWGASRKFLDDAAKQGVTPTSPLDARLKALKGRTLAVSSPGSSADLLMRKMLQGVGLDPEKDVKITSLGTGAAIVAALQSNVVDIGGMVEPNVSLLSVGGKGGAYISAGQDLASQDKIVYSSVIAVNASVDSNPGKFKAIVRAFLRAHDELVKDPDGSMKKVQTSFKDLDPNVYASAFKSQSKNIAVDPLITAAAAQQTIDATGNTGKVKVEEVVRNDIVQEVQKELSTR